VLDDVVGMIGGRQNLRLVDVVDAESFQDLFVSEEPEGGRGEGRGVPGILQSAQFVPSPLRESSPPP